MSSGGAGTRPIASIKYTLVNSTSHRQTAAFGQTDFTADLRKIGVPTLIIHGRRDRLVPVGFARAQAAKRKDWEFVELESCGHVPMMEQPDRFVDVVSDWLVRSLALTD